MIFHKIWKSTTGDYSFLCDDPRFHWQGNPYHVQIDDIEMVGIVEAYLADHPEALVPEPAPPEPTAAEVEAARVAGIRTKLDDLDRKAVRPLRAIAAGTATDADRTMLAEIETQAAELRASIGVTA